MSAVTEKTQTLNLKSIETRKRIRERKKRKRNGTHSILDFNVLCSFFAHFMLVRSSFKIIFADKEK